MPEKVYGFQQGIKLKSHPEAQMNGWEGEDGLLNWSEMSSDLNSIEKFWWELKSTIAQRTQVDFEAL